MKANLSSLIRLDHIPQRYYAPDGEVELAALTRYEKIYTKIKETTADCVEYAAEKIIGIINKNITAKGHATIALSSGASECMVYDRLVQMHKEGKVDFSKVTVFNLTELYDSAGDRQPIALQRLHTALFDHVNIKPGNIHSFDVTMSIDEVYERCQEYEAEIDRLGGLDLVFCEVGETGSLAYNDIGSLPSSHCRLVYLSNTTLHKVAHDYTTDAIPATAFTLGLRNILAAARIVCMVFGENRADMIHKVVEERMSDLVPASFLQNHTRAKLVIDLPASERLTRISRPWKVTSCDWDDKVTRRAIVWLCRLTGKPILKLTNKDYNDNGLGELLAIYGSAYNCNIKIFNDLQHTITGWPGGKPNADDTYRPERALPYPKRVVVFSPHPDDDVISMGGTLKRLVDQKHDVHVAYETSGNIAVGDEDMMRYVMVLDKLHNEDGLGGRQMELKLDEIRDFIARKTAADIDIMPVRRLKTIIRQCEAATACNYIGVKHENVHFCNLPFYETGMVKKGDLAERDVAIIKQLLQEVKPHQIFVAGDLADPHGTHRICTDAVLAALDELSDEEWLRDCRVWMYRGAWAEWEIDHIEMAVPLSPEELRFKRNSILKHQSQMENAPYLGDDERLFWQRAEDRNRGTAHLYSDLGLASYEAIEAFVEYKQLRRQ